MSTRHSADDRKGDPTSSPFRSEVESTRLKGAFAMVLKRTQEIYALEAELATATEQSPAARQRLRNRLTASRNNLASWEAYIDQNAPRERRAVITPAA